MRLYLTLCIAFLSIGQSFAQFPGSGLQEIKSPAKWEASVKQVSDQEYELIFEAEIDDEWHIYSQHTPEGGPIPTGFEYIDAEGNYELEGEAKESETDRAYNDIFGVDEVYFANEAKFTQKVKLINEDLGLIKAQIFYQICKEVCINEEYYFVFNIKDKTAEVFTNFDDFEAYQIGGKEEVAVEAGATDKPVVSEKLQKEEAKVDRGIFTVFWVAFLFGFVALLTPCVFPMIPMTVGFFTKQSKNKAKGVKNALLYGFFIVLIYVVLGTIVTAVFGADALNALSTSVTFNIIFFVILIIFAASFLGAFEIMLPNSWANKVDKQADKGGIAGIFFMALALAIVSFSCTGPIVGSLLVEAASKGGIAPIVGMLGFSLAIAIPFVLFAMLPGWMNSLPKSGGWLNTVKVVLGFLELALAFKFLSQADLVLDAHWLERELFLAIWIAVFSTLVLYLFGKISMPHDSPVKHISVGRLGFGLVVLTFVIYLIPGLWGAPLKIISGFPPPMNYSESPYGVGFTKTGGGSANYDEGDFPEHAELGPHDILAFTDYEAGMAYAKKVGKPAMIDFTGKACINCRKMEERVWSEPQILGRLKSDVVLISLYVDIQKKLPKEMQYTSETTGKRIRTVGNRWSDFQIERFGVNAQPYYVLLNSKEEMLNTPASYMPDVDEYEAWLKEGLGNYKE
ncbi:cytochrome c biogenesis protein CcdA [Mesonia sp. MT50]|uniref:Cytochrome c biogenesis protein CcdA n=1 Tax=Mesonia profundi TaxID=3070998 RepID=A0ABU1A2G0_9FLAO|nr:cytochrome c biogenesis protein CcdA [Mesonia profundi]MDQ7917819.1 cytochrome c biogenesis protein CcdA [Mesonia profundi]